ncbi:hypothetical protein [Streptomyces violascens]|uniref:Uncharacterized protein n=1 Tax=Streptomyces violascens TaxID=67381 RepID=A0ABQ3QRS3_9ACTN|nr:hypothetical protein [Streptomyces violascens]GGU42490.1 hypothetical protein GCM10010289_74010 [Streptomyces violascens]GHI39952.1 hypothetical protein Sviol_43600 [Streptomyces violascens]
MQKPCVLFRSFVGFRLFVALHSFGAGQPGRYQPTDKVLAFLDRL